LSRVPASLAEHRPRDLLTGKVCAADAPTMNAALNPPLVCCVTGPTGPYSAPKPGQALLLESRTSAMANVGFPMLRLLARITMILLPCATPAAQAQGSSEPAAVKSLASELATKLQEKHETRITALDFTDINGRANELGRFLADQVGAELSAIKELTTIDRGHIASIMTEHKLTAAGLVNPDNAKQLGKFAQVDAIVVGTLTVVDAEVVLTVRAISTETSEFVSARTRMKATPDLQRMLGLSVRGVGDTTSAQTVLAVEGEQIALRDIGPLLATLRNVVRHSVRVGRSGNEREVPAIRCTFDLENRNLQKRIAIGTNQYVEDHYELRVAGYRGELVGSDGTRWELHETRGVTGVAGFIGKCCVFNVEQGVPDRIIDCMQSGRKYVGIPEMQGASSSLFWFGSLTTIEPGEHLRLTLDFTRVERGSRADARSSSESEAIPMNFQFDMEFVLATFGEGEDPLQSRDLRLRNLTIDRVTIPAGVRKE
jgi:TolB-like protein